MTDNIKFHLENKSNFIFQYKCVFKTARRITSIVSDVMLIFDDELQEIKIVIIKNFDMLFYPSVYRRNYNDIEIIDNKLVINGTFRNKKLGKYEVYISDNLM